MTGDEQPPKVFVVAASIVLVVVALVCAGTALIVAWRLTG